MAKVTKEDRKKTKKRTGSKKFPMETASQIRSAIKLRNHGKNYSASRVLSRATRAISRLLSKGKISKSTAKGLRKKVKQARKKEKGNSNMNIADAIDKAAGGSITPDRFRSRVAGNCNIKLPKEPT